MATRSSIAADLAAAKRQADQLDNAADKLRNAAGSSGLEGDLNIIATNWTGTSAQHYLQKGNVLKGQINGTESNLRQIASTIRTVAQNIYNAELENIIREEEEAERERRGH